MFVCTEILAPDITTHELGMKPSCSKQCGPVSNYFPKNSLNRVRNVCLSIRRLCSKQCRPKSDCSPRNSLIRFTAKLAVGVSIYMLQMTPADVNFRCISAIESFNLCRSICNVSVVIRVDRDQTVIIGAV